MKVGLGGYLDFSLKQWFSALAAHWNQPGSLQSPDARVPPSEVLV